MPALNSSKPTIRLNLDDPKQVRIEVVDNKSRVLLHSPSTYASESRARNTAFRIADFLKQAALDVTTHEKVPEKRVLHRKPAKPKAGNKKRAKKKAVATAAKG